MKECCGGLWLFSGAVVPVCSVDCVRVLVCTLNAPWQLLACYPLKGRQALCDLPLSIADMPLSGHGFFLSIFIVENSKLLQQFIEHGVRVLNCLQTGFPLCTKINSFIKEFLVFVVDRYFCSVLSVQQGLREHNVTAVAV